MGGKPKAAGESLLIDGRYEVLGSLGEGGMGEVERVRDRRSGREVALKRLLVDPPDASVTELFEREFHTLSELAHPRIIEVYDYGVDERGPYYTMEMLSGRDLRDAAGTDWRTACGWLRDVASSLAILHARRLVHCDLTPRNVRCTSDGRAKLLDFGAMTPMGPPKRILGTPPYTSPEMVQLQSLDPRSDIFALGAIGYWVLTGRHAYPARTFAQLREVWAQHLRAPHEINQDVPRALSDLIMECLNPQRDARPPIAAVVMERLCGVAGLPLEEQDAVVTAYLTTPALVGRQESSAVVRDALLRLMKRRGKAIAVRGPAGVGRSRFLETCALEAKLQGCQVLRLGATNGGASEGTGARALIDQLLELYPEQSSKAAETQGATLSIIGRHPGPTGKSSMSMGRPALVSAACDFIVAATRGNRFVLLVDDCERVDELTVSVLSALAGKLARRPLLILFSVNSGAEGNANLDLLSDRAVDLPLSNLSDQATQQLLGSVFGDVDHCRALTLRLHAISEGNPRALMQLVTHLVQSGVARYEAGSFLLPRGLSDRDLPASLADAHRARLQALEADARDLLARLSLTDLSGVSPADYVALTEHGDRRRTFRALDQLIAAGLLNSDGARYRLIDASLASTATECLSDAARADMHAGLAELYSQQGTITRRGYHLMEAGETEAAIRVLLAKYLADPDEPRDPLEDYMPGLLDLLERAASAAWSLDMPYDLKVEIAMKACGASQFMGDLSRFTRMAPPLLQRLREQSGIADYEALSPDVPDADRLTQALTAVQARYDERPDAERGLAPIAAIRELSRLCVMYSSVAVVSQQSSLLVGIPSLQPLVPLSPAIDCIHRMISAIEHTIRGRYELARPILDGLIALLEGPDDPGLGDLYRKSMLLGARYINGLRDASFGLSNAASVVEGLVHEPGHRANAHHVRQLMYLNQGRMTEAAEEKAKAENALVQDGQHQRYQGAITRPELWAYGALGDLIAVKRLTERAAQAASIYPQRKGVEAMGRFHHKRLQGDWTGALQEVETALLDVAPGELPDWPWLAVCRVQALVGTGRVPEAVTAGRRYAELCREHELQPNARRVDQALAEALLADGQTSAARELAEAVLTIETRDGVTGLIVFALHELLAQVALASRDEERYREHMEACSHAVPAKSHPGLARRYNALVKAGQSQALGALLASSEAAELSVAHTSLLQRMSACETIAERAECALNGLLTDTGASEAFLFAVEDGQVFELAGVAERAATEELKRLAQEHLAHYCDFDDEVTQTAALTAGVDDSTLNTGPESALTRVRLSDGCEFHLAPVIGYGHAQNPRTAIVALHVVQGFQAPRPAWLTAIADALQ